MRDPSDPGGHRRASETHRRAAELHEDAAALQDEHADEIEARDWPLDRERARRLADRERALAVWERSRQDEATRAAQQARE